MTVAKDTASPPRNFTLTGAERASALIAGPPAWAIRKRNIEDIFEELVRALREDKTRTTKIDAKIALLNTLITKHNQYYPIEANLPFDMKTGRLLEGGKPWSKMPLVTYESLLEHV